MTTTTRATTTRRALLVALCALAVLPGQASAHGEASPLIRSVVEDVEPSIDGVRFTPLRGPASLMRVVNRSGEDVEILGLDGEPFLRVGPRGVFGNVHAPAWFQSGNPDGQGDPRVRPGLAPRWRLVARRPEWAYYEHRLHPGGLRVPAAARQARRPTPLRDFAIPFRHGGRPARVTGRVEFRPVLGALTSELRSAATPLPGVTVTLLPGAHPGLLLQSTAREPVVVGGRDGEPFARIGPRGVEVNERSPLHVADLRQRGELPRVAADPSAPPRWRRVETVPSFAWTEPRAQYPYEQPPDAVVQADRPTRLRSWTVPLRAGERRAELRGITSWVPTSPSGVPRDDGAAESGGGDGALPWIALGAALALAAAVALRLRGRRSRTPA